MNKILSLFDEAFVVDYLSQKLLPLYPDLKEIVSVKIKPYKKMIWTETYHVVISFNIQVLNNNNEVENLFLVCSAHSSEPREIVFKVLTFLWQQGLGADWIDIPQPLFFSEEFRGVFYSGLKGENILKKVKLGEEEAFEKIKLAGRLFAQLHSLPITNIPEFNKQGAKIETVVPGVPAILQAISSRYKGAYDEKLKFLYNYFTTKEEEFCGDAKNKALIHGDAHLENLIDTGPGRLGLIDFADFCISDFARDLGTFLQQLEHRLVKAADGLRDTSKEKEMKNIFLSEYLKCRNILLDDNLRKRIKLYHDWTMLRTATYFLLKQDPEIHRGESMLEKVFVNVGSDEFIL